MAKELVEEIKRILRDKLLTTSTLTNINSVDNSDNLNSMSISDNHVHYSPSTMSQIVQLEGNIKIESAASSSIDTFSFGIDPNLSDIATSVSKTSEQQKQPRCKVHLDRYKFPYVPLVKYSINDLKNIRNDIYKNSILKTTCCMCAEQPSNVPYQMVKPINEIQDGFTYEQLTTVLPFLVKKEPMLMCKKCKFKALSLVKLYYYFSERISDYLDLLANIGCNHLKNPSDCVKPNKLKVSKMPRQPPVDDKIAYNTNTLNTTLYSDLPIENKIELKVKYVEKLKPASSNSNVNNYALNNKTKLKHKHTEKFKSAALAAMLAKKQFQKVDHTNARKTIEHAKKFQAATAAAILAAQQFTNSKNVELNKRKHDKDHSQSGSKRRNSDDSILIDPSSMLQIDLTEIDQNYETVNNQSTDSLNFDEHSTNSGPEPTNVLEINLLEEDEEYCNNLLIPILEENYDSYESNPANVSDLDTSKKTDTSAIVQNALNNIFDVEENSINVEPVVEFDCISSDDSNADTSTPDKNSQKQRSSKAQSSSASDFVSNGHSSDSSDADIEIANMASKLRKMLASTLNAYDELSQIPKNNNNTLNDNSNAECSGDPEPQQPQTELKLDIEIADDEIETKSECNAASESGSPEKVQQYLRVRDVDSINSTATSESISNHVNTEDAANLEKSSVDDLDITIPLSDFENFEAKVNQSVDNVNNAENVSASVDDDVQNKLTSSKDVDEIVDNCTILVDECNATNECEKNVVENASAEVAVVSTLPDETTGISSSVTENLNNADVSATENDNAGKSIIDLNKTENEEQQQKESTNKPPIDIERTQNDEILSPVHSTPKSDNVKLLRSIVCPKCFNIYECKDLEDHFMAVHMKKPLLTCVHCYIDIKTLSNKDPKLIVWHYRNHLIKNHTEANKKLVQSELICYRCRKPQKFHDGVELSLHYDQCHYYRCSLCLFTASTQEILTGHSNNHVLRNLVSRQQTVPKHCLYRCYLCGKAFTTFTSYKVHETLIKCNFKHSKYLSIKTLQENLISQLSAAFEGSPV